MYGWCWCSQSYYRMFFDQKCGCQSLLLIMNLNILCIVISNENGKLFLLKLGYSNKYSSQSKFKKKLSLISSLGLPEEAFLGSKNHEQMRINVVLRTVP